MATTTPPLAVPSNFVRTIPVTPLLSPDGATLVTHGPPYAPPLLRPEGAPPEPKPEPEPDSARTAQVWDVASGEELFKARVTGMGGRVLSSAFSGDGLLLALSAADGPVDLFDVRTGKRTQTLLGRKGMGVKVATLPVIALGVGIGVDYALYILSVTLTQMRGGLSLRESYHRALLFTGKVVVLTGVTLAIGVVTWVGSPIKFQADMGLLLAFMFLWNMVGAMVLVPSLACFLLRSPRQTAATAAEGAAPAVRPDAVAAGPV